ncbi:TonB-dependent siderophore receptor [Gloeocapsopsis sp. IPPAS B-1203]|uniref:TonB-dependent siderophore receptor n=1 Tax=Gloeocapsopsis sp. IPPAS B-1203 TaxID=2049454 RepID=UPI000C17D48D|nr:TonB-dependent siderophore receptor [Gloeocapsopsis sp. IPPAS B-1203]PIG94710.1 hypothetical protein CSQ79_05410 [Gloeocapsopsis sp. IPPAS B-1203]
MLNQLQQVFMVTSALMGVVSMSAIPVAWADTVSTDQRTNKPIPELSEFDQPATTVKEWNTQISASLVQITGVQVETSEAGLRAVLQTTEGELATPALQTVGNAVIVDVPNAVLALPDRNEFQQANPIEGIGLVSVTGLPGNRVRVAITGVDAPPTANLSMEATGLVLAVTPGMEVVETDEDAIQIVVTGQQEDYRVPNASTATRTDTPIRDIPQSIQVIPQQIIEDQGSTTLEDALRSVSGVNPGNNNANVAATQSFFIRGFTQNNLFRNGFSTSATAPIDSAGVEQIEVLRGPASVLFGQVEPGGIINVISKRPLDEPYYSFEGQIGSYEFYRPTLDISGPLTEDGSLLYRLNAAYTNADSFRDFVERETVYVAPVVTYQFSDQTRITLDLEYTYDDRTLDRGLPIIGSQPGEIPRSRFLQEPDDFRRIENVFTGYEFEHNFSENWRLRNLFRYQYNEFMTEEISGTTVLDDNRTLERGYQYQENRRDQFNLITDVTGNFSTGSINHTLLLGLDLRWETEDYTGQFGPADPIDILTPFMVLQSPLI